MGKYETAQRERGVKIKGKFLSQKWPKMDTWRFLSQSGVTFGYSRLKSRFWPNIMVRGIKNFGQKYAKFGRHASSFWQNSGFEKLLDAYVVFLCILCKITKSDFCASLAQKWFGQNEPKMTATNGVRLMSNLDQKWPETQSLRATALGTP